MAALKAGELRTLVERFALLIEASKGDRAIVCALRDLAGLLGDHEQATLASLLKNVGRVAKQARLEDSTAAALIPALEALRELLADLARKDLLKGLDSLIKVIGASNHTTIGAIRAALKASESASQPSEKVGADPMKEALVSDYLKRLEASLGDDAAFRALLDELRSDARVQQPEAVEIATRFYGLTPSKTSRPKALARIRERHEKLMSFKKQPSTAGRSAA
jgi:hypothetical protein